MEAESRAYADLRDAPLLVPFQRAPPKTAETELTRRLGPVKLQPRRRSVESFRTCSHHLQKQSEWVRSRYRRTGYRDGSARITRDSEIGRDRSAHGNFARIADHWGTYHSIQWRRHGCTSAWRSEEHTSELQSPKQLVFRLL